MSTHPGAQGGAQEGSAPTQGRTWSLGRIRRRLPAGPFHGGPRDGDLAVGERAERIGRAAPLASRSLPGPALLPRPELMETVQVRM